MMSRTLKGGDLGFYDECMSVLLLKRVEESDQNLSKIVWRQL